MTTSLAGDAARDDVVEQDGLELGGSAASASSVAFGTFANAASVGAKTVNGPPVFSVSTRPAAWRREASVVNWPAATAVETMSDSPAAGFAEAAGASTATAATSEVTRMRDHLRIGELLCRRIVVELMSMYTVELRGWITPCLRGARQNGPSTTGRSANGHHRRSGARHRRGIGARGGDGRLLAARGARVVVLDLDEERGPWWRTRSAGSSPGPMSATKPR